MDSHHPPTPPGSAWSTDGPSGSIMGGPEGRDLNGLISVLPKSLPLCDGFLCWHFRSLGFKE